MEEGFTLNPCTNEGCSNETHSTILLGEGVKPLNPVSTDTKAGRQAGNHSNDAPADGSPLQRTACAAAGTAAQLRPSRLRPTRIYSPLLLS